MLSADDLLGAFSTVPKLTGPANFAEWQRALVTALSSSKAMPYVAQFAPPADAPSDAARAEWLDSDGQVAAAILMTCDDAILARHVHMLQSECEDEDEDENVEGEGKAKLRDRGIAKELYHTLVATYRSA